MTLDRVPQSGTAFRVCVELSSISPVEYDPRKKGPRSRGPDGVAFGANCGGGGVDVQLAQDEAKPGPPIRASVACPERSRRARMGRGRAESWVKWEKDRSPVGVGVCVIASSVALGGGTNHRPGMLGIQPRQRQHLC